MDQPRAGRLGQLCARDGVAAGRTYPVREGRSAGKEVAKEYRTVVFSETSRGFRLPIIFHARDARERLGPQGTSMIQRGAMGGARGRRTRETIKDESAAV